MAAKLPPGVAASALFLVLLLPASLLDHLAEAPTVRDTLRRVDVCYDPSHPLEPPTVGASCMPALRFCTDLSPLLLPSDACDIPPPEINLGALTDPHAAD